MMTMNQIINAYLHALAEADRIYDAIIEGSGDTEKAEAVAAEMKRMAKIIYAERCKMAVA